MPLQSEHVCRLGKNNCACKCIKIDMYIYDWRCRKRRAGIKCDSSDDDGRHRHLCHPKVCYNWSVSWISSTCFPHCTAIALNAGKNNFCRNKIKQRLSQGIRQSKDCVRMNWDCHLICKKKLQFDSIRCNTILSRVSRDSCLYSSHSILVEESRPFVPTGLLNRTTVYWLLDCLDTQCMHSEIM